MINRRFLIGFTLLFCIALMAGQGAAFSGMGSGTQDDPYIITTQAQLAELNAGTGYYKLGNDIPITSWSTICTTQATAFQGTLDGNGYSIGTTEHKLDNYFLSYAYGAKIKRVHWIVDISGKPSPLPSSDPYYVAVTPVVLSDKGSGEYSENWVEGSISTNIMQTAGFMFAAFGCSVHDNMVSVDVSTTHYDSTPSAPTGGRVDALIKYCEKATVNNNIVLDSRLYTNYLTQISAVAGDIRNGNTKINYNVVINTQMSYTSTITGSSYGRIWNTVTGGTATGTVTVANGNYVIGGTTTWTPSSSATGKDGLTVTSGYDVQSWWSGKGYDFANTWYWDSTDNLPKLQVFNQMGRITSLTVPAYTHAQNPNTLTATVELVNQSIVPTYLWEYSSDGTAWNTIGSTQTVSWTPELNPGEYQVRLTVSANGRAISASTSTLVYVTPEAVPDCAGNVSTSTTDTYGAQSAWTLPGTQTAGVFQDISKYVLTANNGVYEIDSVYQTVSPFSDYAFGTITDAYISAQKVATVATGFAFIYDANGNPTRMKNSALGTPARIAVANTTAAVSDGTHVVIFGADGTFKRSITQTVTQLAANSETDVIVGHNAGTTLYIWYGASGTTSQTFPQAITEIHEILGSNSFIVGTAANTYVLSISAGGAKSLVVTSTDNLPLRHLDGTQTYTVAGANAAGLYIFDSTGTTIGTYTEGSTIQANAIARVSGLVTLSGGLDQQAYFFDKSGSSSWTLAQSTAIGAPISAVSLSTDAGYAVVVTQTNKIYLFKRQLTPGQTTSSYYLNGVIMKSSGEKYIGPFSWNGNQLYTDSEGVFTVPVLPGTVYTLICGDSRQQYTATNVGSQSHVFKLSGQTLQSSITYSAAYNAETHAIEMNYQDTSSKTTAVQWRIVNKNDDIVYLTNTTAGQTVSYQVPINETADNFIVTVSANRDNMKVQNTWNVNPQGTASINLYGLDETGRNIIFCFILMILGGLFGVMHSTKGAVIVSFVAVWMRYVEFITVPWICVIIAAVISIIASIGWGGQDKV